MLIGGLAIALHGIERATMDIDVTVAIDDLIAMKQAVGRPIDLADIEHLKRLKES